MDEFVYYGPYGYIEEANYQGITTGGASGGKAGSANEKNYTWYCCPKGTASYDSSKCIAAE